VGVKLDWNRILLAWKDETKEISGKIGRKVIKPNAVLFLGMGNRGFGNQWGPLTIVFCRACDWQKLFPESRPGRPMGSSHSFSIEEQNSGERLRGGDLDLYVL
jgi:hypothetical protein